jgi:hypothetical protein
MPKDEEFKELTTDQDAITLPINGQKYTIAAVDADLGLFLTELSTIVTAVESGAKPSEAQIDSLKSMVEKLDLNSEEGIRRTLGPAFDQMRADGVPWAKIQLAVSTVVTWTVADKKTAIQVWNGMPPKALVPQDHLVGKGSGSTTKKKASTKRTSGSPKAPPGPKS